MCRLYFVDDSSLFVSLRLRWRKAKEHRRDETDLGIEGNSWQWHGWGISSIRCLHSILLQVPAILQCILSKERRHGPAKSSGSSCHLILLSASWIGTPLYLLFVDYILLQAFQRIVKLRDLQVCLSVLQQFLALQAYGRIQMERCMILVWTERRYMRMSQLLHLYGLVRLVTHQTDLYILSCDNATHDLSSLALYWLIQCKQADHDRGTSDSPSWRKDLVSRRLARKAYKRLCSSWCG